MIDLKLLGMEEEHKSGIQCRLFRIHSQNPFALTLDLKKQKHTQDIPYKGHNYVHLKC